VLSANDLSSLQARVTENQRVLAAAKALQSGDATGSVT